MSGSEPGVGSFALTTSDTTAYAQPLRGLYVEVAGNVHFTSADGAEDTWAVPDNFYLPMMVTKVYATGTTSTGIHGIK